MRFAVILWPVMSYVLSQNRSLVDFERVNGSDGGDLDAGAGIRFSLHKEFRAAEIRFYLHREFPAAAIRFHLHKPSRIIFHKNISTKMIDTLIFKWGRC